MSRRGAERRSEEPDDGAADALVARVRAAVAEREAFVPLAVLAGLLVVAGWLVEATVGLTAALGDSRILFRIVLAGAVMAVLRNEVGLRTYGLFAPVIVAFIMLAAGPFWGLALFVNVVVVTLAAYRALRPLKLGTAPRVAIQLSVAGIATSLAFAAADYGLLPPLNAGGRAFFPTIVSAWYADRAAADVEERGWTAPARRLLGTLVAVVAAYLVIATDPLVSWFVTTPLAWGATLLGVAYLGSRPGFRLSEYRRFSGHVAGRLGPLSVARARLGARVGALRRRLTGDDDRGADRDGDADVLSMKRRNRYIETYNPPHLRPAADEKAHVNRRLTGVGVESPRTYAVVDDAGDLDALDRVTADRDEFVVKPSRGYGGEGIVVVSGRLDDADAEGSADDGAAGTADADAGDADGAVVYDTSKGPMTAADLRAHVRRIVDGHYSGLETDGRAILEEKLTPARFMRDLHGDGVADVRVIVFQGYPVMAMTRLPTEASDGAANLHLGAVGVGLDVADGTPLKAYQQSTDSLLEAHPDTGADLTDFRVPDWEGVLETAVRAAAASGLGYTGVDVVLTEGNVPKVLEVNVRPGLGIQNTTERGIFERLAFVESLPPEYEFAPTERKIALAREWAAAGYDDAVRPTADDPGGPDGVDAGARPSRLRERADGGPLGERPVRTDGGPDAAGVARRGDREVDVDATDESDAGAAAGTVVEDVGDTNGGTDAPDGRGGPAASTDDDGLAARLAESRTTVAGALAAGASLVGAGLAGFPVVAALFALVAVVSVVVLCALACGLGGDPA